MRITKRFIRTLLVLPCLLLVTALLAQPAPSAAPSGPPPGAMPGGPPPGFGRPTEPAVAAQQTRITMHIEGISALQLAWWFQHMADNDGAFWKPLAPGMNQKIEWIVNPREDAHQLIGSVFASEQNIPGKSFAGGKLGMLAQFQDYVTQNRSQIPGMPGALNPALAMPKDYSSPYPTPAFSPGRPVPGMPMPYLDPKSNGFNEQLLLLDGHGFAPGRILISWLNVGNDDTPATAGQPYAIDLALTMYQPWMAGDNRPPALDHDDYYYSPEQVKAIEAMWERTFKAMPANLPKWFGDETEDSAARSKGYTVQAVIDTGFVEGVNSDMMVWWWNHAMGDAPGTAYTLWCPPAHYSIRWLPGFSPAEILKSADVPTDHVVVGAIYPDLQGGDLVQDGGGVMSYPLSMSPIPGRYKTVDLMFLVSKAQVMNFSKDRFPVQPRWLVHQWEDRPEGLIHRATLLTKLPLMGPITQLAFYQEHQLLEGQFWGNSSMRRAYAKWKAAQGTGKK